MIDCIKTALVLAPHTDDCELGMGATVHRLSKMGATVHQVAFSTAHDVKVHGGRNEVLEAEIIQASKATGSSTLKIHDFKTREFGYSRQDILQLMIYYRTKYNPDSVFLPSTTDLHQDHSVIRDEGIRCFKHCSIFGYNLGWNQIEVKNEMFAKVTEENVTAKLKALTFYDTQNHRPYMQTDYQLGLLRTNGVHSNSEFAEAFEVIRITS